MIISPVTIRVWGWKLRLVHGLGLALRWLVIDGRPALVSLVATAVLLVLFQNWSILAIYGLLMLAVLAVRARRRVVVQEFVDHSVDAKDESNDALGRRSTGHRGLATLLVVELAELQRLYRVVDERRAIGTAVGEGRPLDATVKVEALSEFLQSAVSAESKVSVGPITIPVGALMALLGRLVQGPQLTGALHAHGSNLIMTAQLTGGSGRTHSWRLESGPADASTGTPDRSHLVNGMVQDLACRMFSDITLASSVNWRATQHFIEALRAFRLCLRVPRSRKLNLKQAEHELIEAFSEDDGFVLVFYNLGVVYTELWRMALHEARAMKEAYDLRPREAAEAKEREAADQLHAAEVAFARAIDQDPGRWEAYYALALTRYERGRREAVVEQCERVLALKPSLVNRAKAYDLKGLAEFDRKEPLLPDALASSKKAAEFSLKALERAELFRRSAPGSELDPVPALRDQATRCLLNLAIIYAEEPTQDTRPRTAARRAQGRLRRIEALFRLALSLTNRDAVLHFELGRIAQRWERLDIAKREYTDATRIDPEQARYWASLAATYGALYRSAEDGDDKTAAKEAARHSCRRARQVMNLSSRTDDDLGTRERIVRTYTQIGDTEDSERIQAMAEFAATIGVYEWSTKVPDKQVREVEEQLKRYRDKDSNWESGHLARLLGIANLANGLPREAADWFRQAIDLFQEDHPEEIRRYGIRARYATAVAAQGGERALAEADRALAVDPLRKLERTTLGQMYFELHDYEHARSAWESALLWSPNDPELYWCLSQCHRLVAEEERRPEQHRKELLNAARYLEQALQLYGAEEFENSIRAHYWLGRLYSELGDFHKVIANLRLVQRKPNLRILGDLLVGEAFLKVRGYEQAQQHLTRVIKTGRDQLRTSHLGYVGREVGDEVPLSLVVAWAHWGRASCEADRDGDMRQANSDIDSAEELVQQLEVEIDTNGARNVKLAPIRRSCEDCRGWIRLKENAVDEAIEHLRAAVRLGAGTDTYLHLALAYETKARSAQDDDRLELLDRSHAYCLHSINTDVTGEGRARAEEVMTRIQASRLAIWG
jgi:cytochrome c-type biogenesis protein CcmH/NrfG